MKKLLLVISFLCCASVNFAQSWELHIASGICYARLLPSPDATPRTSFMRHGFGSARLYFSPELSFVPDEHSRFSFGYQVSGNNVGLQFGSGRRSWYGHESYDVITLHNISVGYANIRKVLNGYLNIGGFVKAGLAYGQMTGYSVGEFSGNSGINNDHVFISKMTGTEVIPDFWSPTSTIGLVVGPILKDRFISDRILLAVAAAAVWKNPYVTPTKTAYNIITPTSEHEGIVLSQGMPLQLQVGIDYRLFRFGKRDY